MTQSAAHTDQPRRTTPHRTPVPDGGEPKPLDLQEMFDLLADPRRRRAVEYINTHGPTDVSEITDHVASEEIGPNASGQPRKRVYIGLYQNHLPALVEAGVLERFDRSYRPGPNFQQLVDAITQVSGVYDTHADRDDEVRENGGPSPPASDETLADGRREE